MFLPHPAGVEPATGLTALNTSEPKNRMPQILFNLITEPQELNKPVTWFVIWVQKLIGI